MELPVPALVEAGIADASAEPITDNPHLAELSGWRGAPRLSGPRLGIGLVTAPRTRLTSAAAPRGPVGDANRPDLPCNEFGVPGSRQELVSVVVYRVGPAGENAGAAGFVQQAGVEHEGRPRMQDVG